MKSEYDFSKGDRGKFYNKDAQFRIPVYLEAEVQQFVEEIAGRKGTDISTVVNELIKTDRDIVRYVE